MVIPLESRQRWLFAGLVVISVGYLLLAGKEFAAGYFAFRPDLPSLERATRLSPGNAEYRNRLGRYFAFVAANPQSALDNYRVATELNPHQARYWFDLAGAYQIAGNPPAQLQALERALRAEPTAPDVAWEAANFFLVQGDFDRALREFRVVIDNDPSLAGSALQTCWRVRPDADVLLRDVVPPRAEPLIAFVSLLLGKHETDSAIKAWDRLVQVHQKFDSRFLFDYVRYMTTARRPDAALRAWEQSAGVLELTSYLPTADNLIVNGDFSLDILNGGLDWTYQIQPGVRLQLDPSDFREGQRSLSISYEGPGISDAGIRQWIPVRAQTAYDFTAYYKASEFQGAGGAVIALRDVDTGQPVFTSDPLKGTDFWKGVHSRFTTPASTSLLVLSIDRLPPGSPIRGKLWLDDFRLTPADSEEHP